MLFGANNTGVGVEIAKNLILTGKHTHILKDAGTGILVVIGFARKWVTA